MKVCVAGLLLVPLSLLMPLLQAQAPAAAGLPAASQMPATAEALILSGDYRGTHDPSIMEEAGKYYVFATGAARPPAHRDAFPHTAEPSAAGAAANTAAGPDAPQITIRCSPDLHNWRRCGAVFPDGIPAWIQKASPATRELWAPDISFYDGVYHLYYTYSLFGRNTSGIALATNRTLDPASPTYHWEDRGLVFASKAGDKYNAIDPNLILDQHGDAWLAFGSYWSGIKMRKLDRATGLVSQSNHKLYSLAARAKPARAPGAKADQPADWQAIEAPFIFQHEGWFYLFASWDLCCRGAQSTYHTVVGRSRTVTGPYVDQKGRKMKKGGGTPVLDGNSRWVGPGGESVLHTTEGDIMVFHAYDAHTGRPALQISTLAWKDGWPLAALSESAP